MLLHSVLKMFGHVPHDFSDLAGAISLRVVEPVIGVVFNRTRLIQSNFNFYLLMKTDLSQLDKGSPRVDSGPSTVA